jgi:Domain of unknown function (DUF1707)
MRYRWDPPYPGYGHRTNPSPESTLRASDAERNAVADKLSRHFAEGRLDQMEFKARLDRAMGATTRGDLHGLFDDLPALADEPVTVPRRRRRLVPFLVLLALLAIATSATISTFHVPWLLFVLVGLVLWHRSGRHHRSRHALDEPGR